MINEINERIRNKEQFIENVERRQGLASSAAISSFRQPITSSRKVDASSRSWAIAAIIAIMAAPPGGWNRATQPRRTANMSPR